MISFQDILCFSLQKSTILKTACQVFFDCEVTLHIPYSPFTSSVDASISFSAVPSRYLAVNAS